MNIFISQVLLEKMQSTFFQLLSKESVDLLDDLDVNAFKVASMDCCNFELLEKIALTGKPIFSYQQRAWPP